jgi:hypothetical protein
LRQILTLADLVKFAKGKPLPPENEQSINNAINFVLETTQVETKENLEEGKAHV